MRNTTKIVSAILMLGAVHVTCPNVMAFSSTETNQEKIIKDTTSFVNSLTPREAADCLEAAQRGAPAINHESFSGTRYYEGFQLGIILDLIKGTTLPTELPFTNSALKKLSQLYLQDLETKNEMQASKASNRIDSAKLDNISGKLVSWIKDYLAQSIKKRFKLEGMTDRDAYIQLSWTSGNKQPAEEALNHLNQEERSQFVEMHKLLNNNVKDTLPQVAKDRENSLAKMRDEYDKESAALVEMGKQSKLNAMSKMMKRMKEENAARGEAKQKAEADKAEVKRQSDLAAAMSEMETIKERNKELNSQTNEDGSLNANAMEQMAANRARFAELKNKADELKALAPKHADPSAQQ